MRRSTAVILVLFVLAAGAYYYLNNRPKPADIAVTLEPQAPTTAIEFLFKAEDGTPNQIRIEAKDGKVVELARGADQAWAVKLPIEASAEQGSVEAAASQLAAVRIVDTLSSTIKASDVGLVSPEYVITLDYENGVQRKARIGVVTPSESGYYAQLEGESRIVIVSRDAIDTLVGLLNNPPYAETPTPSPIPPTATDTPLPPSPEPATPTGSPASP